MYGMPFQPNPCLSFSATPAPILPYNQDIAIE